LITLGRPWTPPRRETLVAWEAGVTYIIIIIISWGFKALVIIVAVENWPGQEQKRSAKPLTTSETFDHTGISQLLQLLLPCSEKTFWLINTKLYYMLISALQKRIYNSK
jgi:hypothetical protein